MTWHSPIASRNAGQLKWQFHLTAGCSSSVPFTCQLFSKTEKKPPTQKACFLNYMYTCASNPLTCVSFNRPDTGCLLSVVHLAMLVFRLAHKIQPVSLGTCKSVCTFAPGFLCPGFTKDAGFACSVSSYTADVCLRSPFLVLVCWFFF